MFSKAIKKPKVVLTGHPINKIIMQNFAVGIGEKNFYLANSFDPTKTSFASYGYLRGTGELYKNAKEFWYLDHGYFQQSRREFKKNNVFIKDFDGYFRIVHNNFWHDGSTDFPEDRFEKLNLEINSQKKNGDYIILSEPTHEASIYFSLNNWTQKTIKTIKKYTDRKIIIHNRTSDTPLNILLEKASVFVSDHSSAGFLAMLKGIPAIFTNSALKSISSIENIENLKINEKILTNLAYCQWTLEEIKSGKAWDFISKNYINK